MSGVKANFARSARYFDHELASSRRSGLTSATPRLELVRRHQTFARKFFPTGPIGRV
jgi:hypothetical protein